MRLETKLCPKHPEHAMRSRWTRPLKVVAPVRARTDFEWTVYGDVIVGRAVAESFLRAGISGVRFLPVEFFTSTETPFGREELELRVKGWGGHAAADSGVRVIEECPCCKRQVFSGYSRPSRLFDPGGWDGSDVFIIWPLPRYIMVTARVRHLILEQEYTGVEVRDLESLPEVTAGTLAPGNPRDWIDAPGA